MLKKQAREFYKQKRTSISPKEKMIGDDLLLIQFQKFPLPSLSAVLSYYPLEENNEPDTFGLTGYLQFINPGLQLAYPKTNIANSSMQAIICNDDVVFNKNEYLIPEPVNGTNFAPHILDMVLVPLLCFDEKGYRVGYGKGYYDRFLQQCRNDCLKIGLSYFEAINAIDDADEFDVPLDLCITPQKAYVF